MIPHMISGDGNISMIIKGQQYYVATTDPTHAEALTLLKEGCSEDHMLELIDRVGRVQEYTLGSGIEVKDGCVLYQGAAVHNTVTERIISFLDLGLPVEPLVNFLVKLMENPSYSSRNQLYDFLEHKNLPITEDGDFLAYKAVRHDYNAKHSGTLSNKVGETLRMARWGVDDERDHGCSSGLHAGALEYVQSYGCFSDREDSDKCIIVKINPANVVSVPKDSDCQKLRTCEYHVLKDYEGQMEHNLYTDDGEEWEDDYDSYEEEDQREYTDNWDVADRGEIDPNDSYRWN